MGFAQQRLKLGEHLLDRVEVGRVRRQEEEPRTGSADGAANGLALVAAEVVDPDDIAGLSVGTRIWLM